MAHVVLSKEIESHHSINLKDLVIVII